MRRKCEVRAVPDLTANPLWFQRFRSSTTIWKAHARGNQVLPGGKSRRTSSMPHSGKFVSSGPGGHCPRRVMSAFTRVFRRAMPGNDGWTGQCRRWGGAHRPRPPNFSTAQTFHERNFFVIVRQRTSREDDMARLRVGLGCAIALLLGVATASAQGTVKIGLINVLSGQFADAGIQLDNGVKTY